MNIIAINNSTTFRLLGKMLFVLSLFLLISYTAEAKTVKRGTQGSALKLEWTIVGGSGTCQGTFRSVPEMYPDKPDGVRSAWLSSHSNASSPLTLVATGNSVLADPGTYVFKCTDMSSGEWDTDTLIVTDCLATETWDGTTCVPNPVAPTIIDFTGPASVVSGTKPTLSWTVSNATSCTINQGVGTASPTSSGSKTAATGITIPTTYRISCMNGSTGPSTKDVTVGISAVPAPTITFSGPATVVSGTSPTLTWSVINVTSCTINQGVGAANPATGGSKVAPTITIPTTYRISCMNGSTGPSTKDVTVGISASLSVSPVLNPSTVTDGQTTSLSYTSTGATECQVSSSNDGITFNPSSPQPRNTVTSHDWGSSLLYRIATWPNGVWWRFTCWDALNNPVSQTVHLTINAVSPNYDLTVTKNGTGTGKVTSLPAGINCGIDCTETYPSGTDVTLTATADSGKTFTGWSGGGCSGTGLCSVKMTGSLTVTATFDTPAPGAPVISLTATPNSITLGDSFKMEGFTDKPLQSCNAWAVPVNAVWTGDWSFIFGSYWNLAPTVTTTFYIQCIGVNTLTSNVASVLVTVNGGVVNGSCGTNARGYGFAETSYSGGFCSTGTASPASPAFPAVGATTNWQCLGQFGGSNAACSATRGTPPPPDLPAGNCVISVDNSSCNVENVSWNLEAFSGPYSIYNTTNGSQLQSGPTASTSADIPMGSSFRRLNINYGNNIIEGRAGGVNRIIPRPTFTATCAAGLFWHSGLGACKAKPVITIDPSSKIIRKGNSLDITAEVTANYDTSCKVEGGNPLPSLFSTNFPPLITSQLIKTGPHNSAQEVKVTCGVVGIPASETSAKARIDVLPNYQEM